MKRCISNHNFIIQLSKTIWKGFKELNLQIYFGTMHLVYFGKLARQAKKFGRMIHQHKNKISFNNIFSKIGSFLKYF